MSCAHDDFACGLTVVRQIVDRFDPFVDRDGIVSGKMEAPVKSLRADVDGEDVTLALHVPDFVIVELPHFARVAFVVARILEVYRHGRRLSRSLPRSTAKQCQRGRRWALTGERTRAENDRLFDGYANEKVSTANATAL